MAAGLDGKASVVKWISKPPAKAAENSLGERDDFPIRGQYLTRAYTTALDFINVCAIILMELINES